MALFTPFAKGKKFRLNGIMLGSDDNKVISYSCSTNVFSTPGNAGLNYVHGGSSPQEMLVPVLDIKMDKGAVETRP